MPKVIDIDVRKIVIKVKEHFSKEREQLEPIAFEKINERLAAATGKCYHPWGLGILYSPL